jgi:hypothetical protein
MFRKENVLVIGPSWKIVPLPVAAAVSPQPMKVVSEISSPSGDAQLIAKFTFAHAALVDRQSPGR